LHFQRHCPVLVQFQAPTEVCEEAIYFQVCKPINVLLVWILVEVEMQELVLITECVRMHLPHQISPATLNSSPCFNGTQKNWLGVLLCPRQAVDYRQVWTIMEIFQSMYLHWEVWLTARLERVWETNHLETMIMCPSNQVCRGCSIVLCIRDRYVVFPRANSNNTKWYQVVKVLVCCYLIESLQMSIDLLAHKLRES
jgi:hypothetical protein